MHCISCYGRPCSCRCMFILQDLLCLDDSGQSFEESFFLFRSTMRSLERRCSVALRTTFTLCPSLMAELRVLDMFQELIKRDAIKVYISCTQLQRSM